MCINCVLCRISHEDENGADITQIFTQSVPLFTQIYGWPMWDGLQGEKKTIGKHLIFVRVRKISVRASGGMTEEIKHSHAIFCVVDIAGPCKMIFQF